jgi:hypothetical protein
VKFPGATHLLVFARSPRQAERYRGIATRILVEDLKLVVNRKKTLLHERRERVPFLGVVISPHHIAIQPKRSQRFKERVRELTPRNHGMNVEAQIAKLNHFLRGWINYFCIANCKEFLKGKMGWIRRLCA